MTDKHETNTVPDARFAEELEQAEADLRAEADAAVSDVPPPDAEPASASGAPEGDSWAPFCRSATNVLQATVFPQWSIDPAQRGEFAVSLGECLDQIAPGGMARKYACWARLIVVTGGIFAGNVIANGYEIPPLGPPKLTHAETQTEPEGELAPDTGAVETGDGFKTAG